MQAEHLLIQKISSRPSTEELIFFIADNDAVASALTNLQKKIKSNNTKELEKIRALCLRYHISIPYLTRELNHIQDIFSPQVSPSNDHKLLGLTTDASIAEVKQAFRRLSIQHHPDTSNKKDTTKFIEITKAYQRILRSENISEAATPTAWRYRKPPPPRQQRKKKNYILSFSVLASIVLFIIVAISLHYQKRTMLNNISVKKNAPKKLASHQIGLSNTQGQTASGLLSASTTTTTNEISRNKTSSDKTTDNNTPQLATAATKLNSLVNTLQLSSPYDEHTTQPISYIHKNEEMVHDGVTKEIEPSHTELLSDISVGNSTFLTSEKKEVPPKKNIESQAQDELFGDILDENRLVQTTTASKSSLPYEVKNPLQKEVSLFAEKEYQQAIIVRPKEKKIRKSPYESARTANRTAKKSPEKSTLSTLRQFVRNYTAAYMSRDIQRFSNLFSHDAQENGTQYVKMRQKYIQLFQSVRSIDYHIDVLGTEIQDGGGSATITGRFRVQLMHSSDKVKANSGTLTFFLIKDNEDFKVKALYYNLDPKW